MRSSTSSATSSSGRDCWAEWLAERRFGGDPARARRSLQKLAAVRDTVLDRAGLGPGETVLDVGCGDGLIAFGALDLVGESGKVVFGDISADLLGECRLRAEQLGMLDPCTFVEAAADDLGPIGDATVDLVTTRSVLIYVKDKAGSFREFHRVLRPGGRISLYEPINTFSSEWSYDFSPLQEVKRKLDDLYHSLQPPGEDPMLDFDERDLVRLAEDAGFFPLELDYRAEVNPIEPTPWDTFLHSSGNPKIPTFGEAMDEALSPAEREELTAHLRPLVEQGRGTWRMAHAYLWARKA
jgi:ubiquinone/menaquinone biosynthesis C-methylase UbiE